MSLRALTGALLAVLLTAGLTTDARAQAASKLDGAWTAVSAERDGKPADELNGHRLTFAGNTFVVDRDGKVLYKGTFKADPARRPARIDFRNTEGEAKGATWLGVYRLEGDTLTIADNAPDPMKPRPTRLSTTAGSGHVMLTFKRAP
jgi:uncharacterized protein (TIGR03067 family)